MSKEQPGSGQYGFPYGNQHGQQREMPTKLESDDFDDDAINAALEAMSLNPSTNFANNRTDPTNDDWLDENILPPSHTFDLPSEGAHNSEFQGPGDARAEWSNESSSTVFHRMDIRFGADSAESSTLSTPSKAPIQRSFNIAGDKAPVGFDEKLLANVKNEPSAEPVRDSPLHRSGHGPGYAVGRAASLQVSPQTPPAGECNTTPVRAERTPEAGLENVPQKDQVVVTRPDPAAAAPSLKVPGLGPQSVAAPATPPSKINREVNDAQDEKDLNAFFDRFRDRLTFREADGVQKALIILAPLSYRHVFSRPWVSKKYVSSIVERPERLMAISLGIGCALSALPGQFNLELCTKRTLLTSRHVRRVHGSQWGKKLYELCAESQAKLDKGELEVPSDWNFGDIYLAPATVDALEGCIGAVETGIDRIFDHSDISRTFVAIRPPGHHSHPCVPSGFCLLNNVHIGIQYAGRYHSVTHAVILDFDLHHGDGSQDICFKLAGFNEDLDENDDDGGPDTDEEIPVEVPQTPGVPNKSPIKGGRGRKKQVKEEEKPPKKRGPKIGYFSIHDINSFPSELGYAHPDLIKNGSVCLNAHELCIWNVHLEPYGGDVARFYDIYRQKYSVLLARAEEFLASAQARARASGEPFNPLIVLSAGFDGSEYETVSMQRHAVNVPTSFFHKFTEDSIKLADRFASGRVLSVLEGGYSDAALSTGVLSHLGGLAKADWNPEWGDGIAAKELEKGCKPKYGTISTRQDGSPKKTAPVAKWLEEGIEMGRALWPKEVKTQPAPTTVRKPKPQYEPLATPSRVLRSKKPA